MRAGILAMPQPDVNVYIAPTGDVYGYIASRGDAAANVNLYCAVVA
jgi:hypothetical protein